MDGGGRLDQSMMGSGLSEVGEAGAPFDAPAFARVGAKSRRHFFWMAHRGLAGRWLFAILAPACVALLIATLMLWRQNDHLAKQLAFLGDSLDQTQKQLDYARNVAHLFEARDTITVSLAPMPGMAKGEKPAPA